MNIFTEYGTKVAAVLESLAADGTLPQGLDLSRVAVDPPRDASHGDLSTNAAMVLAKPAGMKPRDLAALIAERLNTEDEVLSTDIAGPGFINLRLDTMVWRRCLAEILAAGTAYGNSAIGAGERVNVEFVSANPTGPMHIGHARGAVFGDVLASLLVKAGYSVVRDYYVNDAGEQVNVLSRSAYLRYREALGEDIGEIPSGLYPGDYLRPVGKALAEKYGDSLLGKPESEWLPELRAFTIDAMMDMIRGGSGCVWHPARRLHLRACTGRGWQGGCGAEDAVGPGAYLRRRSGTAKGARRRMIGSRVSRPCSVRPISAMRSTGHW